VVLKVFDLRGAHAEVPRVLKPRFSKRHSAALSDASLVIAHNFTNGSVGISFIARKHFIHSAGNIIAMRSSIEIVSRAGTRLATPVIAVKR
jgi:hypothetical protein